MNCSVLRGGGQVLVVSESEVFLKADCRLFVLTYKWIPFADCEQPTNGRLNNLLFTIGWTVVL
jgi:hypothetical protein